MAVYLMTCGQSSMVGIFNLAIPTMAHETGLTADEVRHALAALAHENFAHFDEDEELVWLPSSSRIQVGETLTRSDKRRQQLIKQLAVFGHHRFAGEFLETYAGPYCLTDEPILKGHRRGIEGASKGHPECEPEPHMPHARGIQGTKPSQDAPLTAVPVTDTASDSSSDISVTREAPPNGGRVACPADLELLPAQRSQFFDVEDWAIEAMTRDFRAKECGGPEDEWRPLDRWRKTLAGYVRRRWNTPAERPRKVSAAQNQNENRILVTWVE
jgi:hypothetical protein